MQCNERMTAELGLQGRTDVKATRENKRIDPATHPRGGSRRRAGQTELYDVGIPLPGMSGREMELLLLGVALSWETRPRRG